MEALENFNIEFFLKNHWQKTPCLVRQAFDPAVFPLTPEELAGLACEEEIESRLITGCDDFSYQLQHGPFDETIFNALPEQHWTLLVQAVDHVVPDVARLLNYFRFIPNWRIDDVMVSYASTGGTTGAHYDNYDVFLIQGRGSRLWQVADPVGDSPPLLPHNELRLLKDFSPTHEWELQPGDLLYLPPRYAHWGISTSQDCMTYSVGFRAPSIAELLSHFCDQAIADLADIQRYQDRDLQQQENPGEISNRAIESVCQAVREQFSDTGKIARWFAQYMTSPKYSFEREPYGEVKKADLQRCFEQYAVMHRNPASRFAYNKAATGLMLFVDGCEYPLSRNQLQFVQLLCGEAVLRSEALVPFLENPESGNVLMALYRQDCLFFENNDDDNE